MLRNVLFIILTASYCMADELPDYSPLQGTYELIGRRPDSMETYSGTLRLQPAPSGLRIERTVGGVTSLGSADFDYKAADHIQVLELRFKVDEAAFESTCRIGFDLDNYARLTCVYGIPGKTNTLGLEALFAQHEPN